MGGKTGFQFGRFFDKWGSLLIFGLMILCFCIFAENFATLTNLINILVQATPMLLMALGMTFVNISGESDLSMGGTVGLCSSLFCGMIAGGHSVAAALGASLGVGVFFGLICGVLVSRAGLSSFITTISIMFLTQGLEYAYTGGASQWVRDNPVVSIVTASLGPIPYMVIFAAVVFLAEYLFLHRTKAGLHFQAVGQSVDAARFAGIPVKHIKLLSFVLAGLFYSAGGILNALRSSGSIIYSGNRLLLPVMAVTFIAKTILGAKKPNVPGILVGALIMAAISTAITLLGVDFYYSYVAQGLVLLFAAILSVNNRRVMLQENIS